MKLYHPCAISEIRIGHTNASSRRLFSNLIKDNPHGIGIEVTLPFNDALSGLASHLTYYYAQACNANKHGFYGQT